MNAPDYSAYQPLFSKFGISPEAMQAVIGRWQQTHRYYHTEAHLQFLLQRIEALSGANKITSQQKDVLIMAAFFHDAIYDPTAPDNEEQSAKLFRQLSAAHTDTESVIQIIHDSKTHAPQSELSALFCEMDMAIVTHSSFEELLAWEKGISKEYQFVDYGLYKQHRIAFLEQCARQYKANEANLQNLIAYVHQHRPAIGLYAGSFNPLHNGHLNILQKAEKIFEKVIVAKGINPEKDTDAELSTLSSILKYRQVENFKGLLTDYITEKEKHADITLVRGLRNGDDLSYEVNQLRFMEDMKPDLKVVFIRCDKQFEHISSSAIRNLEKISKGLGDKYIPTENTN